MVTPWEGRLSISTSGFAQTMASSDSTGTVWYSVHGEGLIDLMEIFIWHSQREESDVIRFLIPEG